MSDVNLQLVREFFELNLFRVLTNWQQDAEHRLDALSSQLFVENVNPAPASFAERSEFVLSVDGLVNIERAVIEIRAWHADRFYPSVIESNPVLAQFVSDGSLSLATELFHGETFTTILVVSELPASATPRQRSIDLLKARGIDHVLEFPTVLRGILGKISDDGHYSGSQTLQTIRLLKRYRFIRNQQMEFGFAPEPPPGMISPLMAVDFEKGLSEDDGDVSH